MAGWWDSEVEPSHWSREREAWRGRGRSRKSIKAKFWWAWSLYAGSGVFNGLGILPQLNSLFQLQKLAGRTAQDRPSPLPVLLHCLLFPMLCSLKPSSNSVLSGNVFGLTKCGYSKGSPVFLCSLRSKVNLNFCNRYADEGVWSQFWYNGSLLFCTLST